MAVPSWKNFLSSCSFHFKGEKKPYFVFVFYKFIYLFMFGCVGSSLLCVGFLSLRRAGATLRCGARASHCGGFSCCGARAQIGRAHV